MKGLKGYNPDNLQPWTVEVVASVTVLAACCVALRLFCRHLKAQKLWWDDYFIMFSMVCYRHPLLGPRGTANLIDDGKHRPGT